MSTGHNCNYELLAEYAARIKDDRSIVELVEQSGLSRSFISKLLNQNLLSVPSKRSLKMLSNIPGHNISYSSLLEAAGYDLLDQNTDLKPVAISFEQAVNDHFSEKPASFALGIMLDLLIKKGYDDPFDIQFTKDDFFIKPKNYDFEIVGIPVFYSGNDETKEAGFVALRKYINSIGRIKHEMSYIYLITDNLAVYQYIKNALPPSDDWKLYVSYTNDYKNFQNQYDVNGQKELVKKGSQNNKSSVFSGILV